MNDTTTNGMYPGMRYRNAAKAIDFLVDAFGFEKHLVVPGDNGDIHHAELRFEREIIMVSSVHDDVYNIKSPVDAGCITSSLCFAVDDPDAHYARAKAAGAEIVTDLENTDYGARGYTVRDPEGQLWTFSTYRPDPASSEGIGTR